MQEQLQATFTRIVNAPVKRVWEALTDPAQIMEYLFGTDTQSDFRKGSDIHYTGMHEGKEYHDKGQVIYIIPNRLLHTTYYSSLSGREDVPENYAHVIYELEEQDEHTLLHLTQTNIESVEQLKHLEDNWNTVLDELQKLVEKGRS
jgi:uncharacterized protein YndB with AHSA1/START domain